MKKFNIYTLHPDIFTSFTANSLIARGIQEQVIGIQTINWREEHGLGSYKQVDDKGFGGGDGMILRPEPIVSCLRAHNGVSTSYVKPDQEKPHRRVDLPNQQRIQEWIASGSIPESITISLTPRGWKYDQRIAEFLSTIPELHILCGRYEGFDARVSEYVDLELSLGDYILNGGEVAAMTMIESVSRLEPGFIPKFSSVLHDSFSQEINTYQEHSEYVPEIKALQSEFGSYFLDNHTIYQQKWQESLNQLEHPHYTRPRTFEGRQVPEVLLGGDHKLIHNWRNSWSDQ